MSLVILWRVRRETLKILHGPCVCQSANRDSRQNTFELDLVRSACLGSYRSTLHRPSPLFRNICSRHDNGEMDIAVSFPAFSRRALRTSHFKQRFTLRCISAVSQLFRDIGIPNVRVNGVCFNLPLHSCFVIPSWYTELLLHKPEREVRYYAPWICTLYWAQSSCFPLRRIGIFIFSSSSMDLDVLLFPTRFLLKNRSFTFSSIVTQRRDDQWPLFFSNAISRSPAFDC